MPHPIPDRREHAPPGTERLLADLTPEQAVVEEFAPEGGSGQAELLSFFS
jgi:hypothetical protein